MVCVKINSGNRKFEHNAHNEDVLKVNIHEHADNEHINKK